MLIIVCIQAPEKPGCTVPATDNSFDEKTEQVNQSSWQALPDEVAITSENFSGNIPALQ
jgi:hypothetical protein